MAIHWSFQLVGGFDSAVEGFDSVNFESESATYPYSSTRSRKRLD